MIDYGSLRISDGRCEQKFEKSTIALVAHMRVKYINIQEK